MKLACLSSARRDAEGVSTPFMAGAAPELAGNGCESRAECAKRTDSAGEQSDWFDVDIELYLLHGKGANLTEVLVRDLLDKVDETGALRQALEAQGIKPRRVCSMALYRLGWAPQVPPFGQHGPPMYRRPEGQLTRAPFPNFASAVCARIELHMSDRSQATYTTRAEIIHAIGANHLDCPVTRDLVEATLKRLGFVRPPRSRTYRRPSLPTPLLPCGSNSSTHRDAGAKPEKPTKIISRIQRSRGAAEKGTVVVEALRM